MGGLIGTSGQHPTEINFPAWFSGLFLMKLWEVCFRRGIIFLKKRGYGGVWGSEGPPNPPACNQNVHLKTRGASKFSDA